MKFVSSLAGLTGLVSTAVSFSPPQRPEFNIHPKNLGRHFPPSPKRNPTRICVVDPHVKDTGPELVKQARKCNNGGTVVFLPGSTYSINSPTDLTFLNNIDIAILGTVTFSDDVDYWQTAAFAIPYQDTRLFWKFGGKDVNIFGLGIGTIDGTGQPWWDAFQADSTTLRPVLFGTEGLHGGSISGLNMKNSPNWFNIIMDSEDIVITDMKLWNEATDDQAPPKNTDGWDTYRSTGIVIQNSVIDNYDDCVSFKPNSTNILVQNLDCNGSHGISVGSLGQYQGQVDIVEDIYVYNITMSNASDGARIKIWPGVPPGTEGSISGGGGGWVRNVTYEQFHNVNNDYAIQLTQCYYAASQEACDKYPAVLEISDITFKDFTGTTSAKYDPKVGSLVCSSPEVCRNIKARSINVVPASGKVARWACTNMDEDLLDINCVEGLE